MATSFSPLTLNTCQSQAGSGKQEEQPLQLKITLDSYSGSPAQYTVWCYRLVTQESLTSLNIYIPTLGVSTAIIQCSQQFFCSQIPFKK